MIKRLVDFHGGLVLNQHKKVSASDAVQQAQIPKQIILPLQQHIGQPAEPCVAVGDRVFKGQIVAQPGSAVSAAIHASTSGTVIDIGPRPVPHPSGLNADCIVIKTDGLDQPRRQQERVLNYREMSLPQLVDLVRMSGIVGLGGAGFPSAVKLNHGDKPVDTLILNGVECEPYITCDDLLMQEQATEIIEGLLIMRHALQAKRCIIAIESNKPDACEAMQIALYNTLDNIALNKSKDLPDHGPVEIIQVPTIYPSGGEKQLIQAVTGQEVPAHHIPLDIGIICHNVGTAYAVCRAVDHGEPLISRYVTVTGSVSKARVLEVKIGTPVNELIEQCGGNIKTLNRVIMGGPMMGFALHDEHAPVIKTTNCILAQSVIPDVPLPSRNPQALPCIRCGACADVCPVNLLPQQLFWFSRSREFDKIQDYHLFDCIECGCCDYVCPSHIPLVQYFRFAKTEIWHQEREKKLADISRERHEFRNQRIEREKAERAARHKKKRAAVTTTTDDDKKQDAIKEAMERVRAKREDSAGLVKNTDNLTEEQARLIAEVDARRAKKLQQNSTDDA